MAGILVRPPLRPGDPAGVLVLGVDDVAVEARPAGSIF